MTQAFNSLTIMLVDDNPDDIRITKRALKELGLKSEAAVAYDGEQALQMLRDAGQSPEAELHGLPAIILLDINMPRMNGFEFLKQLRETETLRTIPVVMLTTSGLKSDVNMAYGLGSNTYIQKPLTFDALLDAMSTLSKYWAGVAMLPSAN